MPEYERTYRAESSANDGDIESALDAGINSAPFVESSAAHSGSVNTALATVLARLKANNVANVGSTPLRGDERFQTPSHYRRIGASESGGIMGELSVQRITNTAPPQIVVRGWLKQ